MLSFMKQILDKFLDLVISLFPLSPFTPVIQELSSLPYLGYINWFLPIGDFIKIGTLWIGAIASYYAWSVIARWVKLLG
ncbi:MAG: hypothetical protein J1F18_11380 [Lachnospiraceae bacterium]|nr:hypothetical protein [Lachnospiraceae bacterium]